MTERRVPSRIVWTDRGPEVEWLATDGRRHEEPFFEQTLRALSRLEVNRRQALRRTPIEELAADVEARTPAAFIFHVSRCGSTLLCQMLASLEDSVVVSEAPVLDDVLRGRRDDPSIDPDDRVAWLRGAVSALLGGVPGARRAFVKLDAWHIFELATVRRAFPVTPFVFVFRDPIEVLVSLSRMPSLALVRDTVTAEQLDLPTSVRDSLSREELAAAVVGAIYRAAHRHRDDLVPIAYDQLPALAWRAMPGCAFTEREIDRMRAAAERDAKDPSRAFERDTAEKRRSISSTLSAAHERWSSDPYAAWLAAVAREPRGRVVGSAAAGELRPAAEVPFARVHA